MQATRDALMIPTFDIVGKATVAELCLGMAFLRGAVVPAALTEISRWFDMPVGGAELQRIVARMMERGWLMPHPSQPDGFVLTEIGEEVVEQAFKGFVRFIDAGENRWDVGMMFQIARTHYNRRKN